MSESNSHDSEMLRIYRRALGVAAGDLARVPHHLLFEQTSEEYTNSLIDGWLKKAKAQLGITK